ncbi:MAG: GNAT family N-acetyltransferase [Gammaproteobacteria bacterium]|nr:GNAT family N-acetyltransferase [Gammaproteobacteria bacterium]
MAFESIRAVKRDDLTAIENLSSDVACVRWGGIPHLNELLIADRWKKPSFTREFIQVFETDRGLQGYSDVYQITPKLSRIHGIASNVEVATSLIDWMCERATTLCMTMQTSLAGKEDGQTLVSSMLDHPLHSLLANRGFRPFSTTRVMRLLPDSELTQRSLPHPYRWVDYDESLLPALMSTYYASWPKDYYENEDHDSIAEIFREASRDDLRLISSELEDVVGYVLVSRTTEQGVIDEVVVHPAYRGKGLGQILTQWAIDELGERTITLVVMDENPARFLYEKLGFIVWEERFDLASTPR